MAPTYGAYVPPAVIENAGYLVRPEYSVVFGGTLSSTYAMDNVPIGTTGGRNLGLLEAFGFSIEASPTPITGANVLESGLYEITAETVTINLTLKEWDLEVVAACINNGLDYDLASGEEKVITFGGGAKVEYNPLMVSLINASANKPTTQGLSNGITGMIGTFYRVMCTSQFAMDQLQANENKPLALEFKAVRDFNLPQGQQTGNLYIY